MKRTRQGSVKREGERNGSEGVEERRWSPAFRINTSTASLGVPSGSLFAPFPTLIPLSCFDRATTASTLVFFIPDVVLRTSHSLPFFLLSLIFLFLHSSLSFLFAFSFPMFSSSLFNRHISPPPHS